MSFGNPDKTLTEQGVLTRPLGVEEYVQVGIPAHNEL